MIAVTVTLYLTAIKKYLRSSHYNTCLPVLGWGGITRATKLCFLDLGQWERMRSRDRVLFNSLLGGQCRFGRCHLSSTHARSVSLLSDLKSPSNMFGLLLGTLCCDCCKTRVLFPLWAMNCDHVPSLVQSEVLPLAFLILLPRPSIAWRYGYFILPCAAHLLISWFLDSPHSLAMAIPSVECRHLHVHRLDRDGMFDRVRKHDCMGRQCFGCGTSMVWYLYQDPHRNRNRDSCCLTLYCQKALHFAPRTDCRAFSQSGTLRLHCMQPIFKRSWNL